ncbi:NINE protein [Bartonella raoultii]|uniref:NINE protein n=1 Tax=Bartonella raoultii TaxID=1457020 RepID=A0ABS7I5Q9_9HYPH|nr:TM2 domain-containing protein [Bartonella raoultii]MBX4336211.1 NINE protein [Bartonella raoultii]
MKGMIIGQDSGTYFVSGADGKRYQFETWDWLGKNTPKVGDAVDFVCEGDTVKSVFPLFGHQTAERLKLKLAIFCCFVGFIGVHRFMVGRIGTGILMVLISLTVVGLIVTAIWSTIDLLYILTDRFTNKDGDEIRS